jgi:excisionase family DNA binding protein
MDTTASMIADLIASRERLVTLQEAAILLRVSKVSLRRWDKNGLLPSIRTPSGYRRYRLTDIQRLLTPQPYGKQGELPAS